MNHCVPEPAVRILLPVIVGLGLVGAWAAATATAQDRSWDRYRILVDRNIFRRDRQSARPHGTATTQQRERYTYDSDSSIVLTGLARRDGEFVAFFEDRRTGAITRARVGQPVGKGKIEKITLDEVEYGREGTVRRIEIGRSLTGTTPVTRLAPDSPTSGADGPTARPTESTAATGPGAPDTSPGSTAESDISDILERMRHRREQELRK